MSRFIAKNTDSPLVVKIEQAGDDVNLYIGDLFVGWFSGEDGVLYLADLDGADIPAGLAVSGDRLKVKR